MCQPALTPPETPTIPMPTAGAAAEPSGLVSGLLKSPEAFVQLVVEDRWEWGASLRLLATAVGFYGLYGLTMGVFAGGHSFWMAALKTPLILIASLALCAPSLYVLLCLGGTPVRWRQVVALLAGVACLSSLLLVGFAPVSWLFGVSTDNFAFMTLLHLAAWTVALACGLRLFAAALPGGYRQHQSAILWVVIYLVVTAQMLTYFRPILGAPEKGLFQEPEKKFFFTHFAESVGGKAFQ